VIASELEYFAYNNKSFLRALSPLTKFFLLLIYLFLNLFLKATFYWFYCGMVLLIVYFSNIPFKLIKNTVAVATFTGFFVFVAKLHYLKNGAPIKFLIDFYPDSFLIASMYGFRIINGVILMLVFVAITPIRDFLTLLHKLKVPEVFIEIFLIIFKYIFLLYDEGLRVKNAKTVRLGYKGFKRSLESFGNLIGIMLIRGLNKGTKISTALYVRGYNGRLFYPSEIAKPKNFEYVILLFFGIIPLLAGIFLNVK
jgi:cobalt/nickel transport system permease protein